MTLVVSHIGCLLPFLIIFNLFFGLFFLELKHWLFLEGALILLFALNAYFLSRRAFSAKVTGRRGRVIDVEAKDVSEERQQG